MYEEFFGLQDQPFRLSPDYRFFYQSSAHNRALAHLRFGLDQREGFILITGEVGAGKTMLVEHLLASLNPRHYVAANIVTTNLDQENLIRMIASSYGLAQEGLNKTSVFRTIERFLADSARQGRRCLLFIDEAQNLSIAALEELRMLSNLQINGQSGLQSFLLGQPQFRKTLARSDLAQLRQRVIASYHLGPLSNDETAAYILHRLEVAGWQGDPDFEGEALSAIHEICGGIPRRINTLTNRLLLNAYLEEGHVVSVDAVEMVSREIAEELGQVIDSGEAILKAPPHASAELVAEVPDDVDPGQDNFGAGQDRPIPHVENAAGEKPADIISNAQEPDNNHLDTEIPVYESDEEDEDIVDLTIHMPDISEELSFEAEQKLKKRALHTVIDFFGGRGGS